MSLYYLAFTEKGTNLARAMERHTGGEVFRSGKPLTAAQWTDRHFQKGNVLVFIGACGIAVRSIAPYIKDKTSDPAVLVADEAGQYVIPILSGHLGCSNDWARILAEKIGAVPVLTTATDVRGVFAVDEWAKRQNMALCHKQNIVTCSSRLLAGKEVVFSSPWEIKGTPPANIMLTQNGQAQVVVSVFRQPEHVLHLVPRIVVLGVGCRRGVSTEQFSEQMDRFFNKTGLCVKSLCAVASIDIKKDEPALTEFCSRNSLPLLTYSAQELAAVEGTFSASEFVQKTVGVENVCERAACLGAKGTILLSKQASGGVTVAAAQKEFTPDWSWTD